MTSRRTNILPSELSSSSNKRKSGTVQVLMPFQKDVTNVNMNTNIAVSTNTTTTTNNMMTNRISGTIVKRRASTATAALAAASKPTDAFPMYTTAASGAQHMSTRPHSGPLMTVGVGR